MILSMFHNSSRRSSLVRSLIIRHQKYIVAIIVIAIVLTIYSINWSVRMNEEVQISKTINGPITHMLQITKSTERYTPKCTDPYFRDKSIIIMVTSAPDAFERRTAIRETWGSMPANVSSIGKKRIWLRNWKSLIALCAASIILLINYVLWVMAMNQGLYESRAIRHPVKKFIAHSNELGDLKASCLTPDYKKNSVIIMVTSSPNAFDKRQAIRESWGSIPEQIKEIGATVTVRFVLGDTSSQSIQKKINLEARDHRDILQGAFKDSYNNLTIKSVYAMNWVFKNCEHKFMMKTDHDMWINTPNLVKYIKSLNSSVTNLITGYAFKNVAPFRNQFSRYYVSYEDYYENYYPNFISGTAYLISRYALSKLLKCLLSKNQLLHLEDVQITGICAKEAAIERMHHDQFHYPRLLQCGHQITHAITAHGYSPNEMKSMWDSININQNMFSSEFVYICNIFSKEITGLSIISVVVVILLFVRAFSYFAHKEYTYIYALFIHEIIALIFIIIILLIIFSKSLENIYPI